MSGMIMRGVEKIFNSDNMRTNLELWLIVEQNFDILFDGCICDILLDLQDPLFSQQPRPDQIPYLI